MIELPFPSSILSGHAKGNHQWLKIAETKKHRKWAYDAALAARMVAGDEGDILVSITFIPPHNRGDRLNFPNRSKPYFDGLADALGVNDKRILPHFIYRAPEKPGRVIMQLGSPDARPIGEIMPVVLNDILHAMQTRGEETTEGVSL